MRDQRGLAFTAKLNVGRRRAKLAVMVFHTQRDMLRHHTAWRKRHKRDIKTLAMGPNTQAMSTWAGWRLPGFRPDINGCVWLHMGRIGPGVLAHEMTHIANFIRPQGEVKGFRADEPHAYLVGSLVTQFYRKFHQSWWGQDAT